MAGVFSIAEFQFENMSPVPPGLEMSYNFVSFAGFDGHDVWQDAVRGRLYQARTLAFSNTLFDSKELLREYEDFQRSEPGPHEVIWADQSFDWKVLVLRLNVIDCRTIVATYINSIRKQGRLICNWDLLVLDEDVA